MKYWVLAMSAFKRKKTRTIFTLMAVAAAFMLFGLLFAIRQGMNGVMHIASANRIITQAKLGGAMPLSYDETIASLTGVAAVSTISGFRGSYQNDKNTFQVLAVTPAGFLAVYPEIELSPAERRVWFGTQTGAVVGSNLARRFHWKVGDRVPVQEKSLVKKDGSHTWEMPIKAIYRTSLPARYKNFMLIHYRYLNQSVATGTDTVFQYTERVSDPRQAPAISKLIDDKFASASPQTRTETEVAQTQTYMREFGNIGAITLAVGAAVFFSMLLVTVNTMAQSVRERTCELAVLKALGFAPMTVALLVLVESIGLTAAGGVVGLGLSFWLVGALGASLQEFLPAFGLPFAALGLGAGLIVLFGCIAGCLPLPQVLRLQAADVLRRG